MSHRSQSEILEEIRREDEESQSELSDEGSETSDHIITEGYQSAEESNNSNLNGENLPLSDERSCLTGRDKVTKWLKFNNNRARHQVQNILTEDSGTRRNGVGVTTFMQAWNLFITENMIEKIVTRTNEFIQKNAPSYDKTRDCQPTDGVEIRALFGLLYIAGSFKMTHANLDDLYASDGTGLPIFSTTMSLERSKFLLNSLRFDNASTRILYRNFDKAALIRDVLEMFKQNCLLPYSVGQNVVIDEMMLDFRGKCPFRQYIKSKPDKYGIKLYSLVDAATHYVLNIELDAGKPPVDTYQLNNTTADVLKRLIKPISDTGRNLTYQLNNTTADVLKRLIKPISDTGRNLTINSWPLSEPLVVDLAKNHKIAVVGTIRKTNKEIPPFFTNQNRPEYSSQFGFSNTATLVSYVPKKKKSVVLISSLHFSEEIDASTNEKRQPSIVTFYNKTKGSVNEVDKKVKMYSTSRKNNSWPLTVFFRLLDIAGLNAMVVLRENNVVIQKRRKYLRALGIELTKEYVQRNAKTLSRKLNRNLAADDEVTAVAADAEEAAICPVEKTKQSKTQCDSCHRNICRSHATFICHECYPINETDLEENYI